MRNKAIAFFVLILITFACNAPGSLPTNPAESTHPPLPPATSVSTEIIAPTATAIPTETAVPPTATLPPTPMPTPTIAESDLPFTIDCSALPASRKAECDAFIAATREQVYPIYREVTGVSLSKCYKSIHYIIITKSPAPGAGGISAGDTITYDQKYSVDLPHRYDVHELLHSVNMCTGALDNHVLHGLLMNYAYFKLGVTDVGYFTKRTSQDLTVNLDFLMKQAKTASGKELKEACRGILMRKTTLAYFELGPESVKDIYQSTIEPLELATQPSQKLIDVWGADAKKVEALLETLKQDFKYSIDVPECGY